ncbi:MAG TPA: ABC transporter ATP-binding protein [Bellilinea sp.]|nr:ABC transporter ATP-binding protein [Bellilinea sp.]
MGMFSGLDAEKYDRKYSDRDLFKRILFYFKPFKGQLILAMVFVLILGGISALMPIVISQGVDRMGSSFDVMIAFWIGLILLVLGVGVWALNWASRRITARTIALLIRNLSTDAFRAATTHDLSFHDENPSGKIVSRITSDTSDFGNLIELTTHLLSHIVQSLILLVVLLRINAKLTLMILPVIPVILGITLLYRNLARKTTRAGMRAKANVNQSIKETVSGIAVAKNFRQEEAIFRRFDEANVQSYKVNVSRGLVLSSIYPIFNMVSSWVYCFLLYIGGVNAAQGAVTVGVWYLFLQSYDRFMYPVMDLTAFWTQVQNGLSAAERVFALIDAPLKVIQTADAKPSPITGEIKFENVDFAYVTGEPVLKGFNLTIAPGENIALVGHTGAGKSSIGRLVARFYEFQSGKILVDGHDIRSLNLNYYRSHLGIVSQIPFLFSGTVLENIRYSNKTVSREEVMELAKKIGEGEWLQTLPDGLESQVGERGSRLSMGQRQLVSLMRVLVQRPSIFILDEATASIDPFTEWQIQQALNLVLANSTSILIAHRLLTVRSADRILVLDHGQVIEQGTHDQLLTDGGHYAELYNTYFRHQSLAYVEEARAK